MDVRLSSGSPDDEQAVRNLFVPYFHELAAWDPGIVVNDLGLPVWHEFGLPGPRTLEECVTHNWWIRDRCVRYAIRSGEAVVGFAVVAEPPEHLEEHFDWEIVDFYVAPKARRSGAGSAAVRELLQRHHGDAVLFTLAGNAVAQRFWRAVLAPLRPVENDDGTEFRFRSE
jgi:predicted acetyltransferase